MVTFLRCASAGLVLSAFAAGLCAAATEPANAHQRYLFLDPALLTHTEGAEVHINPASRRETVIRADRPWEKHMISFFLTVREDSGKLRMWYICRDDYGEVGEANVAYAESRDGITWEKPNLGLYAYKGSRDNNLIGLHSLEGVVFQDPNMPPQQRYVYVSASKAPGESKIGLYRFTSPDGLRWQRDAAPLIDAGSDTQNVVWWDERRREYVIIVRGWNPDPKRRKVSRLSG